MFRKYNLNCGQIEKICWLNDVDLKVGDSVALPPVGRYEQAYPSWIVKQRFNETEDDAPWRSYTLTGVVSAPRPVVEPRTKSKKNSRVSVTEQLSKAGLEKLF